MNYYMHSVPGRLRVKTPLIKGKEHTAKHVEVFLQQIRGVYSISTNPITGSIIINYDVKKVSSRTLLQVLQNRGIFDSARAVTNDQYIQNTASKAGHVIYKAFLGTIVEQSLRGSPLALLGLLI
jgi:hypothetical protein